MTNKQLLIVEDEPKIANILRDVFTAQDFDVHLLHDGQHAIDSIKALQPDFIILDLMLPNKDGLTICKEVRQFSEVPVLMLTARVDEIDRLIGLEVGADDYVCKPFSAKEVAARVKTILRRTQPQKDEPANTLEYQQIRLLLDEHQCFIDGQLTELTPVEFRLLCALLTKPGVVFNREQLMSKCYEDQRIVSHRTIDSHMKNLRSKLSTHSPGDKNTEQQVALLHSIYGVGYKIS